MMSDNKESLRTAIWLTSKSRIHAEMRYRRYDLVAHLLLSWLSLSVIAWSVVRGSITVTAPLDTYAAILSVFVFAFSVIIFGFSFGETAAQHRECYLKLQKLQDSKLDDDEINRQYHEILGGYGNHNSWDYDTLILDRTLYRRHDMWDRNGQKIAWTWPMLAKHLTFFLAYWITVLLVFLYGFYLYYFIATQLL